MDFRKTFLTWTYKLIHSLSVIYLFFSLAEKLNNCTVYNRERMINTVDQVRKSGRSLITYCNHDSCIDDPTTLGNHVKGHAV